MVESETKPAGGFGTSNLEFSQSETGSAMAEAVAAALEEPDIEFWRMDSRRLTFSEWGRLTRGPATLKAWISKALHLNILNGQFVPRVPKLRRFELSAQDLGLQEAERLKPRLEELSQLGFHSPVFAQVENPFEATTTTIVSLMHPSRYSLGRVTVCLPKPGSIGKEDIRVCFLTELADGGYLVTSANRQEFDAIPGVRHRRLLHGRTNSLWHAHQEELAKITTEARPIAIRSTDDLWRVGDEYEQAHFDAAERRGLYVRPNSQR
jgi:hypothetical protein